jgi:hypothetical protein
MVFKGIVLNITAVIQEWGLQMTMEDRKRTPEGGLFLWWTAISRRLLLFVRYPCVAKPHEADQVLS